MSNPESIVQAEVMLAIGALPNVRIFRNTVGAGWQGGRCVEVTKPATMNLQPGDVVLRGARRVTFGLCPDSPDLIGWTTVEVTPGMTGRRLAVFTAPEVKTATGRPSAGQERFMAAVTAAGGKAGIVRSGADAVRLISG